MIDDNTRWLTVQQHVDDRLKLHVANILNLILPTISWLHAETTNGIDKNQWQITMCGKK